MCMYLSTYETSYASSSFYFISCRMLISGFFFSLIVLHTTTALPNAQKVKFKPQPNNQLKLLLPLDRLSGMMRIEV